MKIAFVTPYQNYPGGAETVTGQLQALCQLKGDQVTYFTEKGANDKLASFDRVICNGEWGLGVNHPKAINLFHGSSFGYRQAVSEFLGWRSSFKLWRQARQQQKSARGKKVVAVSHPLKAVLEQGGIHVDRVIECGIDLKRFYPFKVAQKGDGLFVGSCDVIGKGLDVIETLKAKGRFIDCVHGAYTQDEMPKIYNAYRILFFPSRFEGFGLAPLEAMACGLPVVMSRSGIGREIEPFAPEFVAQTFDPQEYLEKAKRIDQTWDACSEKARVIAQRYPLEKFETAWEEFLQ